MITSGHAMPRRPLRTLLLLPLTLLLAACSLTQYNVSEREINDYLKQQVAFEKQIGIPGIMSSKIRLDEMQSRIGRSRSDRIELDAAGDLQVASPLGSQQMKIRLSLSARPDYVAEQGAIYLRDLELLSVKTEPADIGTALSPLLPTFNQSLGLFLNQTPIYRLDGHRQNEARIKEKVEALRVEPGRLVIPFKLL
ncbi:lipoprotein [Aeromonas bivalvium]|uniref:lipoprotein n=1 Tax=Aeromonas bivalvium TaxID=440079 RepID=UPI0038D1EE2D